MVARSGIGSRTGPGQGFGPRNIVPGPGKVTGKKYRAQGVGTWAARAGRKEGSAQSVGPSRAGGK